MKRNTILLLPAFLWACGGTPGVERDPGPGPGESLVSEPAVASPESGTEGGGAVAPRPSFDLPSDEIWQTASDVEPDMEPPKRVAGDDFDPWSHVENERYLLAMCLLGFVIDETGASEKIYFLAPRSASRETRSYFLGVAQSWRFEPAMRRGEPVRVRYLVSISDCPYLRAGAA